MFVRYKQFGRRKSISFIKRCLLNNKRKDQKLGSKRAMVIREMSFNFA